MRLCPITKRHPAASPKWRGSRKRPVFLGWLAQRCRSCIRVARRNCVSPRGKPTVLAEHLLKVPLAEDDDVIDALAPDRSRQEIAPCAFPLKQATRSENRPRRSPVFGRRAPSVRRRRESAADPRVTTLGFSDPIVDSSSASAIFAHGRAILDPL